MVCSPCVEVVKAALEKPGLLPEGEMVLPEAKKQINKGKVKEVFVTHGFERLDNKKSHLVEKIKSTLTG